MKKTAIFITAMIFIALSGLSGGSAGAAAMNNNIKSAEVTMVTEDTDLSVKVSPTSSEDYYPLNRQWNGIPTVISAGNNIFVAWYTGGTKEPHDDNYIVVAASDDNGQTWREPYMIIDPVNPAHKVVLPMFFYNGAGELWLYYVATPGGYMGIKMLDADGPLDEVTFKQPFQVSPRTSFVKPTMLSDGRIMYVTGGPTDGYSSVFVSEDDGYSYREIALIKSTSVRPVKTFTEACVVELEDGRLWMVSRLESGHHGGLEQAFSSDGGLTWTISDGNLPYPLQGPGSRISLVKLQSGALLLVNNDNTSARNRMKAFLSYDDGETWPHSIMIDSQSTSYPEVYQDDEGLIYIAYDRDRYFEGGIRVTMLTEEDIVAGEFISDAHRNKLVVTKMDLAYADIVSLNGAYDTKMTYPVGTTSDTLRTILPATFTVTDSNGDSHELTGSWRSSGYKQDIPGTYTLTFIADEKPSTLLDAFDLLQVKVTLTPKGGTGGDGGGGGCNSAASAGLLGLLPLGLAMAVRKRKRR